MNEQVAQALIYSFIAFSIVFLVLGGLTVVIYGMRLLTGGAEADNSSGAPREKGQAANVKPRHVAAITAAIQTLTRGRGQVSRITPR